MARASAPRVRALTNQMIVIQRAGGMLVCPAPPAAPLARSDRPSACTPWLRTTCTALTRWADLLKKETPQYSWRTQHATAAPCFSCVTFGVHLSCPLQLTLYLRLLAEYPATKTATGVEITVPLPRSVQRVHCETGGWARSRFS